MAVRIRLTRLGDKKSPFYRVVVADSRTARDGKVIEQIGTYNPLKNPAEININTELAKSGCLMVLNQLKQQKAFCKLLV